MGDSKVVLLPTSGLYKAVSGFIRLYMVTQRLDRDNGKENGSYYLGGLG